MTHHTVDITTRGRRSGEPRRIEIWIHHLGERRYITGLPGRRGWYANLVEDPDFVLHPGDGGSADVPSRARPVTDPGERRAILGEILPSIGRGDELDRWLVESPIVEVEPRPLD